MSSVDRQLRRQGLSRSATGTQPRAHRGLGIAGFVCVLAGLALILWTAAELGLGLWQERQLDNSWHRQLVANPPPAVPVDPDPHIKLGPVDGVDFAIRVPRIDYYHAVQEGIDSNTLLSGPGHYPEMAWPGQPGNVGVAAHNTYWIRFGDLARGDEVDLETRYGTYKYRVTGSRIVNPDDRTVLVQTPDRRLTLTTCWPLYAGAFAQQRYVITAEQFYPTPREQRLS
jgi:LPXTG-site transpeptidase (sortase) family protein